MPTLGIGWELSLVVKYIEAYHTNHLSEIKAKLSNLWPVSSVSIVVGDTPHHPKVKRKMKPRYIFKTA